MAVLLEAALQKHSLISKGSNRSEQLAQVQKGGV